MSNLTLEAATEEKAIRSTLGAVLEIDLVDFCGSGFVGDEYAVEIVNGSGPSPPVGTTSIYRSRFCDCVGLNGSSDSGSSSTVTGCVFESAGLLPGDSATIQNNIFYGDSVYFRLSTSSEIVMRNNTLADISSFLFGTIVNDHAGVLWPSFEIQSNIFGSVEAAAPDATTDVAALWYVYLGDESIDDDGAPDVWTNNIVWDVTGAYAEVCVWDDSIWDEVCDGADASSIMAAGSITLDPLFSPNSAQGIYALDPTSPAIDGGVGGADMDGSTNDIGAFGGPEGDWYMEVPWLP